jgi:glycine oxidase
MSVASPNSVVIAGGGAIGLACAVKLARSGLSVTLVDPAVAGSNASGVAAGMLAPAFEAVLDPASAGRFALFKAGRDAWMDGPEVDLVARSGALWVPGPHGDVSEVMLARFAAVDAQARLLTAQEGQGLSPGLDAQGRACLFTAEDWRLDPSLALSRLHQQASQAGAAVITGAVVGFEPGCVSLADGQILKADRLVIAAGLARGLEVLAPELACLAPIKGQILFFDGSGPTTGPSVRTASGYVAPRAGGAAVGATMDFGREDLSIDPAAEARLRSVAEGLYPGLTRVAARARAGVRAATPDGLPLVGASASPGVYLACGARRNGWLLAPLVAGMIAAYVASESSGPWSAALDPRRFDVA